MSTQAKRTSPERQRAGSSRNAAPGPEAGGRSVWPSPSWALAIAAILTAAAYANALRNGFVHDDHHQIEANHLIQHARFYGQALRSDVWAFMAFTEQSWSNYWRPGFVLWMIANFALFGLRPMGWHLSSIVLHLGVVWLAYHVLRRLKAPPAVAAGVTWLFAVHPAHVESVTWIAGSTDLLLGAFFLGAYALYLRGRGPLRPGWLAGSLLLFTAAVFSKGEVVVATVLVIAGTEWVLSKRPDRSVASRLRRAALLSLAYGGVAGLYLGLRIFAIGMTARAPADALSHAALLLTAPKVFAFYLRQALVPIWMSPLHALRAVTPATVGFVNLGLPLLVVVVAALLGRRLWRRGPLQAIGLLLFAAPLAPAFYIRVFSPEEYVHDRYLYLPVLGLWLALAATAHEGMVRRRPESGPTVAVAGLLVSLVFAGLTMRYNTAWFSDETLWAWAVRHDDASVEAHARLGNVYRKAAEREPDEAARTALIERSKAAYARAQALQPDHVYSAVGLGGLAVMRGDDAEAIRIFEHIVEEFPTDAPTIEHLASCYERQGRFTDALTLLEEARERLRPLHVELTFNLGVVALHAGDLERAERELASIGEAVKGHYDRYFVQAWHILGAIREQRGQREKALDAYATYLNLTEQDAEPETMELRYQASDAIRRIAGIAPSGGT